MLQCKLRLSKEERDIVTKAAIKHFNTLINGYHPKLTVKKDPDCSYLKLQMDGFDELCYYILFDEYDDGTPFYLVYYGRLNWGGLPNWQSPDKKCDSLQSVGIAIAEHYVNYIWNENESLHFKDITMDKKLEARIARLERLASRKRVKNEGRGREAALRVSEFGGTLLSYMMDLDTYANGELSSKLNEAYSALADLVNFIDSQLDIQ